MILDDETFLRWRQDGEAHRVGPLTLRYGGAGEAGPQGACEVKTEDAAFLLDWMDAEAIAFCIAPSADLWIAYDSDREKQDGSGAKRGWFRLKLTSDKALLDPLTGWAGKAFQVHRVVMNAGHGQIVRRRKGERTTDYRRAALEVVGGPAKAETRASFRHACAALARHLNPDLPANWENTAKGRWLAADGLPEAIDKLKKEANP